MDDERTPLHPGPGPTTGAGQPPAGGAAGRRPARGRLWYGLGAVLVLALAAYATWGDRPDFLPELSDFQQSVAEVEALILSWGPWGAAASILLMVLHSFVPFPAEILAMANGMLYGPLWGTLITWTGAMLGAWLAFGLSRWLGRPFVRAMVAQRHHAAVDRWAARQGAGALLFSRFLPVISFNLINYAAGLTAISWWTFTWATGLGILPLTVLMVVMGDRLWSGEGAIWLWLVGAAALGWLVWSALAARWRRAR